MKLTAYGLTLDLCDVTAPGIVKAIESDATLAYLIRNGFTQSIGDAGAVPAVEKYKEADHKAIQKYGSREAWIIAKRQDRLEAILNGTVAEGGPRGPALRGFDAYLYDETLDFLRKHYAKEKAAWMTGKGTAAWERQKYQEFWARPRPQQAAITARAKTKYDVDHEAIESRDEGLDDLLP